MKIAKWTSLVVGLLLLVAIEIVFAIGVRVSRSPNVPLPVKVSVAKPPVIEIAPLQVAMVFGRAQGCDEASPDLIQATAQAAMDAKIDPRIAAATLAVESACNQFAVSSRGAIGFMQVMPRIWKDKYDFTGSVNLLNRQDNIRVGAQILGGLVKQYGVAEGVRRYQGTGETCDTCDGRYTSKILSLARVEGKK